MRSTWFLVALVIICSCSNDEDESTLRLPDITQEGLNTFGCLVNGELFIPSYKIDLLSSNFSATYSEDFDVLIISARNIEDQSIDKNINITIKIDEGVKKYIYEESNSERLIYYNNTPTCFAYYMNYEIQESFVEVLHLDEELDIISGIFEFVGVDTLCQDTIYITDGRFDVTYR